MQKCLNPGYGLYESFVTKSSSVWVSSVNDAFKLAVIISWSLFYIWKPDYYFTF